jgi:hypothetical protein
MQGAPPPASGFCYPTDPSDISCSSRDGSALARFLRREAKSLFYYLQTATERHES